MKDFARGVGWYTNATVEICFPEDDVCCARCPLMGIEMASSREYCRKTGEYLPSPKHIIGFHCPLDFHNFCREEEICSEI